MPLNCRFWTWEEWTQTGSQIQEDVAQSPKTRLVSGLADISLIGDAKGIIEGATGQDLLTGESLQWWQRGLSLLCLSEFRGIGRLGVVADALPADSITEIGRLGGQLYGEQRLAALTKYLNRRGVDLLVGDEFLPPSVAGVFRVPKSGRPQLILTSNPTEYEVWHELSHYLQYRRIGSEAYAALPRSKVQNAAEQFVFDMLENPRRWGLLSFEEQQHAIDYIERVGGFR